MIEKKLPLKFCAGDQIEWRETHADYPASLWTIKYVLVGGSSNSERIEITSTSDSISEDHVFFLESTTTDNYLPGDYAYQRIAVSTEQESNRKTLAKGHITIEADLFKADAVAPQKNWLDRAITALEEAIAGRASDAQLKLAIDGYSVENMSPIDQMNMLSLLYKRRAARSRARRMAAGQSPFIQIKAELP